MDLLVLFAKIRIIGDYSMRFDILTIFARIFDSYFNESILKRVQKKGLVKIAVHDLRNFAMGKHRKVDDSPYGGGPGMVFMVEPIYKAVKSVKSEVKSKKAKVRVVFFSTRGKKLDAKIAKRLAKYDQLILICGRYEGVDERVAEHIADEEISIGDFVLSGGELPAMILVEAVSRFIPGVLGKKESLEETHGSFPQYTAPRVMKIKKGHKTVIAKVPDVLLSGDHKKIAEWRRKMELKKQ